jgi:hypothetical protein
MFGHRFTDNEWGKPSRKTDLTQLRHEESESGDQSSQKRNATEKYFFKAETPETHTRVYYDRATQLKTKRTTIYDSNNHYVCRSASFVMLLSTALIMQFFKYVTAILEMTFKVLERGLWKQ